MPFIRYTEVIVGPPPGLEDLVFLGRTYDTGKYIDGKWRNGIHIEFDIRGDNSAKPEDVKIMLFNRMRGVSSTGQRAITIVENSPIVVKSGYLDSYDVIFLGQVKWVNEIKDGPDVITEIHASSAYKSQWSLKTQKVFKGAKVVDIAKWLAQQAGLPIGYIVDSTATVDTFSVTPDKTLSRHMDLLIPLLGTKEEVHYESVSTPVGTGRVYSKKRVVTPVARWKWYVKQGRFYLMPKNYAFKTGLFLSYRTGLISFEREESGEDNKKLFKLVHMLTYKLNKDTVIVVEPLFSAEIFAALGSAFTVSEYRFVSTSSEHIVEAKLKPAGFLPEATIADLWEIPVEVPEYPWEDVLDQLKIPPGGWPLYDKMKKKIPPGGIP